MPWHSSNGLLLPAPSLPEALSPGAGTATGEPATASVTNARAGRVPRLRRIERTADRAAIADLLACHRESVDGPRPHAPVGARRRMSAGG
ncbi:hypothetical protein WMF11_04065 [Sorangium sp. So ce295]|uniref:hypothetical protein n=1 Tax=Sorangium sp. So ce295 TaxID=3133295 RepID=UPI003F637E99